jgi:hypothetical protein
LFTTIAPDGGVIRTAEKNLSVIAHISSKIGSPYAGAVDVAEVDVLLEDVVETIDDEVVDELEILEEVLEEVLVDETELDVLEVEEDVVVDAAVLIHEQPLDILEGKPEHAVVAQAGSVTEAVAVV